MTTCGRTPALEEHQLVGQAGLPACCAGREGIPCSCQRSLGVGKHSGPQNNDWKFAPPGKQWMNTTRSEVAVHSVSSPRRTTLMLPSRHCRQAATVTICISRLRNSTNPIPWGPEQTGCPPARRRSQSEQLVPKCLMEADISGCKHPHVHLQSDRFGRRFAPLLGEGSSTRAMPPLWLQFGTRIFEQPTNGPLLSGHHSRRQPL
jgi:hypothetical protein